MKERPGKELTWTDNDPKEELILARLKILPVGNVREQQGEMMKMLWQRSEASQTWAEEKQRQFEDLRVLRHQSDMWVENMWMHVMNRCTEKRQLSTKILFDKEVSQIHSNKNTCILKHIQSICTNHRTAQKISYKGVREGKQQYLPWTSQSLQVSHNPHSS